MYTALWGIRVNQWVQATGHREAGAQTGVLARPPQEAEPRNKTWSADDRGGRPEYVTFKCASFAIMRSYAVNGSPTL